MKNLIKFIGALAFVCLASSQASANICTEAAHYKHLIDKTNAAMANKSAGALEGVLNELGAHPTAEQVKGGAKALKILVEVQEGQLYTAMKAADLACKALQPVIHHKHLVCGHWHGHDRAKSGHWACRWRDD